MDAFTEKIKTIIGYKVCVDNITLSLEKYVDKLDEEHKTKFPYSSWKKEVIEIPENIVNYELQQKYNTLLDDLSYTFSS
jgi:hypothetical protein